jgi:hypothetical protein
LENEQFKEQFANRFMQLVFTNFSYQNTKPYFDYIKEALMPEVPNQIERFNYPSSFSVWENYCMPVIDWFLRERPGRIIEELNTFLSQIANPKAVPAWTFEKDFELLKIIDQIEA